MLAQIALCKVVARPVEQKIKGLTVVCREGKEQRVALPFGGADFARVTGINDAPAFADVVLLKLLPGRPGAGGANVRRRHHQNCHHTPAKRFHRPLLTIRMQTTTADDTQQTPHHPCQQHNADCGEYR
ncbi:hypothetical protein D3C72_800360 [compost metagenome]